MPMLPSQEYWIQRAERTLIAGEKSALAYEKDLEKAYKQTIAKITKEIDAFYGRYAKENKISLAESRRRLTNTELKDFQANAKRYLDEVERLGSKAFTEEYRSYLRELSGKAYISRMQELITNIRHHIETNSATYEKGFGTVLKEGYEDGYYRTLFDVQKQAGFGVSFSAPGAKRLETAVREKWAGRNYSDSIWEDKRRLVYNLEQILSQEFVRGKGSREVAKVMADKLSVSFSNAKRLVRTEINYISNKATMQAYKDSGVVTEYEYVATLDKHTSDICREMDGRHFPIEEAKSGINLPPLHPYCRSTTIPYYPDDEIGKLIDDRVATDENGHTYRVGKNVTFQEWVNNYAEAAYAKRVKRSPKKYAEVDQQPVIVQEPIKAEPLPKTLVHLDEHEQQWYQSKILSNVTPEEAKEIDNALKELVENNDFAMRVPDLDILDKIIDGGFKTQFETNTSKGALSHQAREKATSQLFGLSMDEVDALEPGDFEKYGYLASKDVELDFSDNNMADHYGDICIRFKRERVINRTTMTVDDSLGPARARRIVATKVTDPKATSVEYTALRVIKKSLPKYIRENINEPYKAIRGAYGLYFELQYHGKLTIEDVESVSFKEESGRGYSDVIQKLKDLGIKVYQLK